MSARTLVGMALVALSLAAVAVLTARRIAVQRQTEYIHVLPPRSISHHGSIRYCSYRLSNQTDRAMFIARGIVETKAGDEWICKGSSVSAPVIATNSPLVPPRQCGSSGCIILPSADEFWRAAFYYHTAQLTAFESWRERAGARLERVSTNAARLVRPKMFVAYGPVMFGTNQVKGE